MLNNKQLTQMCALIVIKTRKKAKQTDKLIFREARQTLQCTVLTQNTGPLCLARH